MASLSPWAKQLLYGVKEGKACSGQVAQTVSQERPAVLSLKLRGLGGWEQCVLGMLTKFLVQKGRVEL